MPVVAAGKNEKIQAYELTQYGHGNLVRVRRSEGFHTPLHEPINLARHVVNLHVEIHRRRCHSHDQDQRGRAT